MPRYPHPIHQMAEQPLHLQGCSLGYSASFCSYQEYAGHAHPTKASFLESAFHQPWALGVMDCLTALVKQIQQHFCTGFSVRWRPPVAPAEDLWVVVAQPRGDGDRSQVFFHEVESLDPVLEVQACMPMDSKVTGEEVPGYARARLDWHKCLFSCSSVHPRTSVCKGRPHCFPSLQM